MMQLDEIKIAQTWERLQAFSHSNGKALWEGECYRLENLEELYAGSKKLRLSTIKYSTVRSLIELNKAESLRRSHYPLHINTGALIKTSDDHFVFGTKNPHKGSFSIDMVGGGLQASELEVYSGSDFIKNLLKELEEETNLAGSEIEWVQTLGFVLSHTSLSVITVFEVGLTLNQDEVIKKFRQKNDCEFSDLLFVSQHHLTEFLDQQSDHKKILLQLKL